MYQIMSHINIFVVSLVTFIMSVTAYRHIHNNVINVYHNILCGLKLHMVSLV